MIEAGGGSIINISSLAGLVNPPKSSRLLRLQGRPHKSYQASGGGLRLSNVRCNVVCPGAVKTDMIVGSMTPFAEACGITVDDVLATFSRDVPLRRVSRPEEIAGLCSYLASDDASFLTAAVIPLDGGAAAVDVSGAAINQLAAERLGNGSGAA